MRRSGAASTVRTHRRGAAVTTTAVALAATCVALAPLPPAAAAAPPPGRVFSTVAYDTVAQRTVMFGGSTGGFALGTETVDDTWSWNGTAWKQTAPSAKPPARKGAVMAYDKSAKATVLFGGDSGCCTRLGDTWTRGTATKTWVERSTPVAPAPRSHAVMAYDPASRTVVLFGGLGPPTNTLGDSTVKLGDTWTWNGATGTWTQQTPAVSPPARSNAMMAFDSATGTVVLFGGESGGVGGGDLSDTWVWDGTAKTWTQRTPAVSPPARHDGAMSYHRATSRVVLFGGAAATRLDDTWTWSGAAATWAQQAPVGKPSAREGAAMADHLATGVVVLFGGTEGGVPKHDTWTWNGTNWKQRLS